MPFSWWRTFELCLTVSLCCFLSREPFALSRGFAQRLKSLYARGKGRAKTIVLVLRYTVYMFVLSLSVGVLLLLVSVSLLHARPLGGDAVIWSISARLPRVASGEKTQVDRSVTLRCFVLYPFPWLRSSNVFKSSVVLTRGRDNCDSRRCVS